ncbi:insecticidal delta-endotoxin Cry8Ea1 family protein [Bacillus cereus]|nr:insecticidal delta-endotoxin Cry8Ea1 family protein [Bacillus cereus]PEA02503.1 hypothetical protein CON37_22025 [Bacillus cereus]
MTHNDNNNKFEIKDTDTKPRSPLANAPGPTWQNINNRDVETFGSIEIAGKVVSGVISSVIKSLRQQAQIDKIVAIVVVEVFEVLWPVLEGMWYAMMDAVEIMIQEAITTAVRSKAQAELNGIRNALVLFQQAFDDWEKNSDNPQLQDRVRRQFTATNTLIQFAMSSFAVPGFQVPLLVVYAQAANLHLLFLREAVVLGEKWGMSREEVDDYYNGELGLTELTQSYTNHCTNWYHEGLAQSMKLNPSVTILEQWNLYNDFRREMTIMILDIVALWPTYDVKLYPAGTKTELTRIIYTPLMGVLEDSSSISATRKEYGNIAAINQQDGATTIPPALFIWLEKQIVYPYNNLIYSYQNFQKTTFGKVMNGTIFGSNSEKHLTNPISIPIDAESYDVYKVDTSYSAKMEIKSSPIHKLVYYRSKEQQESIISTNTSKGPIDQVSEIANEGYQDYSHCLAHMAGWVSIAYGTGLTEKPYLVPYNLALGWTYANVDPVNSIAPDAITQIPAVKGDKVIGIPEEEAILGEVTAIQGPGFTGGNLVGLFAGAELHMKVTNPVSNVAGYQMRIRYANNHPTILAVSYQGVETSSGKFDVPVTYSGDFKTKLTYNAFKFKEAIIIPSPLREEIADIVLRNEGDSNLLIDKIELIPMDFWRHEQCN